MKLLKFFSKESKASEEDVPTIDSLKSDELWQFIERPAGGDNADARIADLKSIWDDAQKAAENADRSNAQQDWVIHS